MKDKASPAKGDASPKNGELGAGFVDEQEEEKENSVSESESGSEDSDGEQPHKKMFTIEPASEPSVPSIEEVK